MNCTGEKNLSAFPNALNNRRAPGVLKVLIDHGADINALTSRMETPLLLAVKLHQFEDVKYLVERGADMTIKDMDGKTPIDYAIENGYREIAKYLAGEMIKKIRSQ